METTEKGVGSWAELKRPMRSWQIGFGLVAIFTLGFYLGIQQETKSFELYGTSEIEYLHQERKPVNEKTNKERVADSSDSSYSSSDETLSKHYADEGENDLVKSTDAPEIVKTVKTAEEKEVKGDEYDAEAEIKMRREEYLKHCQGQRQSLMSVSYRTGLVSRYGKSTGDVSFFTCFLPKAASSSMSAAMLLATGWIDLTFRNEITDTMWDDGRNKCSRTRDKCLKEFREMPQRYRYMGAHLDAGDRFVSLIVAREPMSRLVSAWRDKIYRRTDRQFYFEHYTRSMLSSMGKYHCPKSQTKAWDAGCRVPFKDFVSWVAAGNRAADEHWTPATELCVACQANYTFIAHSEHFGEDIQVAAKMLQIDPSVLPDNYHQSNLHAAAENSDTTDGSKSTAEMFADVSPSALRKIREIYRSDYELFNYRMPDWLKNA